MTSLPPWIADPILRTAWERIRTRFEQAGLHAAGVVQIPLSSREERHAVGALLGRSVTSTRVRVDLAVLDARLRERSGVGGLQEVLNGYFGTAPRDRPAARAASDEARERPLTLAAELVTAAWAGQWIAGLRRTGLLTGRTDAERVVRDAAVVLAELTGSELTGPERTGLERSVSAGTQSRVELAARLLGDSHALDRDRIVHQVVLRGLAAATGTALPDSARAREELWSGFGIEPDLLSRTCLVWGLRLTGTGLLSRRLALAADAGDPVHLTAWDLRRAEEFAVTAGIRLLVCENPRVVEALAEHGVLGLATVCTAGEPNLVVDEVLTRLSTSGSELLYHGDFDWPGIALTNRAIDRYGVCPWLMSAADYDRAARVDAPPLRGAVVEPQWDPELGPAMRRRCRALHEESVLPELIRALAPTP